MGHFGLWRYGTFSIILMSGALFWSRRSRGRLEYKLLAFQKLTSFLLLFVSSLLFSPLFPGQGLFSPSLGRRRLARKHYKDLQKPWKAEKQRRTYHVAGKDRLINKSYNHVGLTLNWRRSSWWACRIMAHEFKNFLYVFCGKQKIQPTYTYEEEDNAFYCEVSFHPSFIV